MEKFNALLLKKDILTVDECAMYLGMSKAYLYKLTMRRQIPHYKPNGKKLYFERKEVEAWMRGNRIATDKELTERAQEYC